MRIPAMFKKVADLQEQDLAEVESKIGEEVKFYQERALKKIEQGSLYSSDFEEVEESDSVDSDESDDFNVDRNVEKLFRQRDQKKKNNKESYKKNAAKLKL